MATSTDSARMLLPEPFNGTGDISAYITQFELLSNLQSWLAPRKDADGNPELDGDGNQLYTDKRHQIFPLRLRAGAIEFYHSLDDETKNDYKSLRNAFEKQYLEPPEFFRGALRKRSQGESEKVTEFLADLKLLAKKAYPDDSEEIREHLVMQAFLEGLLDQNVRLEIRKEKDISLADALKKAVHLDAIYRLEIPSQGGVNNGLNNSPHGVGSIDRLINRMDSMMNKMAISQINSNSGRDSRRPSRPYKTNKNSQSPRQGFSRNQYNSRERYKSNQKNNTGSSSSAFRRNSNSRSPRRPLSNSSRSPSVNRRVNFNKEIVCYQCNRKGHTKNNCRNCWSCGSSSHTRRNCPQANT